MRLEELPDEIEQLFLAEAPDAARVTRAVDLLLDALENGAARAAEPHAGGWRIHRWVKRGILLAFRASPSVASGVPPVFWFRDREAFPTQDPNRTGRNVRVVPGGTTVRRGAHLADGVIVMPPAYVNVGAWVGEGSMIDSHALIGSCAQVGSGVHVSAAVQIGGVLEPVGALPVIVEDGAFLGGGCGLYEGVRVGAGAVLAPGVILSRAVPLFDLVRGRVERASAEQGLAVPPRAVVVPGSRRARGELAEREGLQLAAAVIVKYRDERTDAAVALEEALR